MEKFVTDLDKLLDDFESEDIENSNRNIDFEPYDSSGYNSLKVSTDLQIIELDQERHTPTLLISEEMYEQPTPTTNDPPEIYSGNYSYYLYQNSDNSITTQGSTECTNRFTTNSIQSDKRRTENDPNNDYFDDSLNSPSPTHMQVPPRKKSRPNSLLGLSSVVPTVVSTGDEITTMSDENTGICTNDTPPPRTMARRPHSLNIGKESSISFAVNESTTVDTIRDECTIPEIVLDGGSPLSQDKVSSNSLTTEPFESAERPVDELNIWQGIPVEELGQKEPTWIGDEMSDICMQCEMSFTMFRRRHHCRACGRLLCNKCCCWRIQLRFSSKLFPKDRVCAVCFQYLIRVEAARKHGLNSKSSNFQPLNSVLKSNRPTSLAISPNSAPSSNQSMSDSIDTSMALKSVMFADGIRPGGDLTELDKSRIITPTRFQVRQQIKSAPINSPELTSREPSLINDKDNNFDSMQDSEVLALNEISVVLTGSTKLTSVAGDNNFFIFAITRNLHIHLQKIRLPYCTCSIKNGVHGGLNQQECDCDSVECWYFASMGLETIGLEEIVIILKRMPDEATPPIEIFKYYFQVYQLAFKNETKSDNMESTVVLFSNNINLKEWAGILHIRPSFQCLNKIPTPRSSFLIGILIHRWEFPWAMLLPLRLILALGNQSRFYPCSIVSDRDRPAVYGEVGQTILQVVSPIFVFPNNFERGLCDSTIVPTVPGMWLHLLATQETIVQIPKHSYSNLLDILSSRKSEHNPLALAACFSREADSHLVCCQNDDTGQYYSRAISIQNTERMITGSTMILFVPCNDNEEHGTTIVEDAIVVKLSQMQLGCVVNSLKTMSDLALQCGSSGKGSINKELTSSPALCMSMIKIVWTDSRQMCDLASIERPSLVTDEIIQSALGRLQDGGNKVLKSCRVPSSFQNMSSEKENQNPTNLKFVWTRFHMVETGNSFTDSTYDDPVDYEEIIREIACNFSNSIIPFLDMLREVKLVNIGLRTKIGHDSVDWLIGCSKNYPYTCSQDQSPTEEIDSRNNSYVSSKLKSDQKVLFNNVESLPDVCIDYLNEVMVPFLYSKTSLLRNGSLISELEFHIID